MNLQVTKVKVRPKHKLYIKFNNGKVKLFDVTPYLEKGIFTELKNENYLKKVRIVWGGIEWPHEQDLSVDTLYRTPSLHPKKVKRGQRPFLHA